MKIYKRYWQVTSFEGFWFDNAGQPFKLTEDTYNYVRSSHSAYLNKRNLYLMLDELILLGATEVDVLRFTHFLNGRWIHEFTYTLYPKENENMEK